MDVFWFCMSAACASFYIRGKQSEMNPHGQNRDCNDNDAQGSPLLDLENIKQGKSLNAQERVCIVTADNIPVPGGASRSEMRLDNLWHRATYVLIKHDPTHPSHHRQEHGNDKRIVRSVGCDDSGRPTEIDLEETFILVQKRSKIKDYCPGRMDPTPGGVVAYGESYLENALREVKEEMGIDVVDGKGSEYCLKRLFTFPYEDERVRVWGEFYELTYSGALRDLILQEDEVESVNRMSLAELKQKINESPQDFMPDSCHAMRLYFQRLGDWHVNRKLLKGYSSSDLDSYGLRPKPAAIFFDCDDCLYFDGWKTAKLLTHKIDEWCVEHGLKQGEAYQLYKQYGTALRGLLAEGYLEETDEAIDSFLREVHDLPIHNLLQPDHELRHILERMDPTIPKYIFTASVRDHAERCARALGIADLFVDIIDCKMCNLETKHSRHSFQVAMRFAGIEDPERCLLLDDNLNNIHAARQMGWRSILVGRIGRDHGQPISSEHAENEIERIHDIHHVLPELFPISRGNIKN